MAFAPRHKKIYKSSLSVHTERTSERFERTQHRIITFNQQPKIRWAHHEASVIGPEITVAERHGQVHLQNASVYLPPIVRLAWPTVLRVADAKRGAVVKSDPTPWNVTFSKFVPSPRIPSHNLLSTHKALRSVAIMHDSVIEEHAHEYLDISDFHSQATSGVVEPLLFSLVEHQLNYIDGESLLEEPTTAEALDHSLTFNLVIQRTVRMAFADSLEAANPQVASSKVFQGGVRAAAIIMESFAAESVTLRLKAAPQKAGISYYNRVMPSVAVRDETVAFEQASSFGAITPSPNTTPACPNRKVVPENNKLFSEVLTKVIEDTKIREPFYMRHIHASDNSPDHVVIIPKSLVNQNLACPKEQKAECKGEYVPADNFNTVSEIKNVQTRVEATSPTRKSIQINAKQRSPSYSGKTRQTSEGKICIDKEYAQHLRRLTKEFRKISDIAGDESEDEITTPRPQRAMSVLE